MCTPSGAEALRVQFHPECSTERRHDPLTLYDAHMRLVCSKSGRDVGDWCVGSYHMYINHVYAYNLEDIAI